MHSDANEPDAGRPISAQAVGTLVAFLNTSGMDRHRYRAVNRLRALRDSDEFATLPEELRARVQEVVGEGENGASEPSVRLPVTILGRRDFVVIVRRWRQRGTVRHPGVWIPAGVVDSRELAEAMAGILREEAGTEARAVSAHEVLYRLREEDRERILERLNSRTTAEIERDHALRRAAEMRLAGTGERRSGRDRRSGSDRRVTEQNLGEGERRRGLDRRSGRDRRSVPTAA